MGTVGSLAGCNAIRGVIGGDGSRSASSTDVWRAPEGTAEATGLSSSGGPGPDASEAAVAQFRDGLHVRNHTSPLVGDDGVYEVTSREAPYEDQPPVFRVYAHAHSREDGSERWRTTVVETEGNDEPIGPGDITSALGPDRLYAVRNGGPNRATVFVDALSREDGATEWSRQLDEYPLGGQPVVHDETLYLFAGARVIAVDAESGDVHWDQEVAVRQRHPVVGEGAVAIYNTGLDGTYDAEGQVTVFDADDGSERWSEPFPTAGITDGPIPTIADGTVYLIEGDTVVLTPDLGVDVSPRKVHARSLDDGSEEWTHTYESDAMQDAVTAGGTSFVTVAGDHLYFALVFGTPQQIVGPQGDPEVIERLQGQMYEGPNVFALDRGDGSVAWEAQLGDRAQVFLPLVVDDEHLYARRGPPGVGEGAIHVLDRDDGEVLGSFGEFEGRGPVGIAGGDLYVHDEDRVRIFR